MGHVRPAGRTQFVFWPAGRPAGRLPDASVLASFLAGRQAAWLAGWLCLLDVFVHILQYSTQLYSTNTVQYCNIVFITI